MEIDITQFVRNADPFEFSASRAERGQNAGPETWRNACDEASGAPLLTVDQIPEFRSYMRGFGAWSEEEIAIWSETECNALFIQLISGDLRECGLDECDPDEFDWSQYERDASAGLIAGNIFRADDGRIFYYVGS